MNREDFRVSDLSFRTQRRLARLLDINPTSDRGWQSLIACLPGVLYDGTDVANFSLLSMRQDETPAWGLIKDLGKRGITVEVLRNALVEMDHREAVELIDADCASPPPRLDGSRMGRSSTSSSSPGTYSSSSSGPSSYFPPPSPFQDAATKRRQYSSSRDNSQSSSADTSFTSISQRPVAWAAPQVPSAPPQVAEVSPTVRSRKQDDIDEECSEVSSGSWKTPEKPKKGKPSFTLALGVLVLLAVTLGLVLPFMH